MTNKQIIKKAIEKVEKNDFDLLKWYCYVCEIDKKFVENNWKNFIYEHKFMWLALIFSPSFAKAFWKPKKVKRCSVCGHAGGWNKLEGSGCHFEPVSVWQVCSKCKGESKMKKYEWEQHLRQIVLEKNQFKYLEKFLKEK